MSRPYIDWHDERGVSGALVAISVLVIIGMAALSVDGGSFLLRRRQMVSAADAAALAYGIACVESLGDATAQTNATTTAKNSAGTDVSLLSSSGGCSTGKVTVTYKGNHTRLFMPLLGRPASGTVSATASAAWGGAAGSVTPPIEVTKGGLQNCNFAGYPGPPPPGPEPKCTIDFLNGGGGQWGGVNTTNSPAVPAQCTYSTFSNQLGWNVCGPGSSSLDARPNCSGMSAQDAKDAMNGNVNVTLNPSGTTWVCSDNGQTAAVWNLFNSMDLNKIFCFPVTDDTKAYFDSKGKPKAYDVIGYVPLRVISEFKDNNPKANTLHLTLAWTGPQPCGTSGGGPPGFGAFEIGLSG